MGAAAPLPPCACGPPCRGRPIALRSLTISINLGFLKVGIAIKRRPELGGCNGQVHQGLACLLFIFPEVSSGVNCRGQMSGARGGQTAPFYPLPIRMPAAKTSAPPSTTWNVARKNGVSI